MYLSALSFSRVQCTNNRLCVWTEITEGSESERGSPEEEDERTGVVSAVTLAHHPIPHSQQTRQGITLHFTYFIIIFVHAY